MSEDDWRLIQHSADLESAIEEIANLKKRISELEQFKSDFYAFADRLPILEQSLKRTAATAAGVAAQNVEQNKELRRLNSLLSDQVTTAETAATSAKKQANLGRLALLGQAIAAIVSGAIAYLLRG